MTISVCALAWLVGAATAVTMLAPLVLVLLWIGDWSRDRLW